MTRAEQRNRIEELEREIDGLRVGMLVATLDARGGARLRAAVDRASAGELCRDAVDGQALARMVLDDPYVAADSPTWLAAEKMVLAGEACQLSRHSPGCQCKVHNAARRAPRLEKYEAGTAPVPPLRPTGGEGHGADE